MKDNNTMPARDTLVMLLVAILFFIAACMTSEAKAQFKVGNLSMDQATFDAYMKDLWMRPDTMELQTKPFLPNLTSALQYGIYMDIAEASNQYNKNIKESSIGSVTDSIWSDYIKDVYRCGTCKHPVTYHSGYLPRTRYLIPRKPSEEDFVRWYNKIYKPVQQSKP